MAAAAAVICPWRIGETETGSFPTLPCCSLSQPRRSYQSHFVRARATASAASSVTPELLRLKVDVQELKQSYRKWNWKGIYDINYVVFPAAAVDQSSSSAGHNLVLVHGFGASIPHWRWFLSSLSIFFHVYIYVYGHYSSERLCNCNVMYIALSFRNLLPLSSQGYTVYAIDLLGFGTSDKPPGFQYNGIMG